MYSLFLDHILVSSVPRATVHTLKPTKAKKPKTIFRFFRLLPALISQWRASHQIDERVADSTTAVGLVHGPNLPRMVYFLSAKTTDMCDSFFKDIHAKQNSIKSSTAS